MSEEYNNGGPPLKHINPIWEKATMTLDEASEYSGIGRNTLYRLTNQNNCPFVLRSFKTRLVIRIFQQRSISIPM